MADITLKLTTGTVPILSIVFMVLSLVLVFAIPFTLMAVIKKKTKARGIAFGMGVCSFLGFALILESIVHGIVLTCPIGATIQGNIWIYAVYGAFMAGLFEESGRFVFMKFTLKKYHNNKGTALMYGAGHGGFEAMYLLGVGMISNIIYSIMINARMMRPVIDSLQSLGLSTTDMITALSSYAQLIDYPSWIFLMGLMERISAIVAHIAMSIVVWEAVTTKKYWYIAVSFAMHFILDFVTVVLNSYLSNMFVLEVIILAMSAAMCVFAYFIYKNHEDALPANDAVTEA